MSKPQSQERAGDDPVYRPKEAAFYLGISRPTLHRWRVLGMIPAPSRIGISAIGWRRSVLDGYIRSREGVEVPHAAAS